MNESNKKTYIVIICIWVLISSILFVSLHQTRKGFKILERKNKTQIEIIDCLEEELYNCQNDEQLHE